MSETSEKNMRQLLYGLTGTIWWIIGVISPAIMAFEGYDATLVLWMRIAAFLGFMVSLFALRLEEHLVELLFNRRYSWVITIACAMATTAVLALAQQVALPLPICFVAFAVAGFMAGLFLLRWGTYYVRFRLEAFALPFFLSVCAALLLCALISFLPVFPLQALLLCLLPLSIVPLLRKQPAEVTMNTMLPTSAAFESFNSLAKRIPLVHGFLMAFIAGVGAAHTESIGSATMQQILLVCGGLFLLIALLGRLMKDNLSMNVIHRPVMILMAPALLMLPFVLNPNRELACMFACAGVLLFLSILWVITVDIVNMVELNWARCFTFDFGYAFLALSVGLPLGVILTEHFGYNSPIIIACLVADAVLLMATAVLSMEDQEVVQDAFSTVKMDAPEDVQERGMTLEDACIALGEKLELSPREIEVFTMLAQGRDPVRIQDALFISYNTVRNHIRSIYKKLDVHSRQELLDLVESELKK
ncbi:MAG: LuxR family transcriptional regulator [Coriobacteriales bacterium]|nr:LuxR family transcriptional regulator [Coriobacteriales bacterium]